MDGVAIKLTFSLFHTCDFLVTILAVGWLMKASKSDFGAQKEGPPDGKNYL